MEFEFELDLLAVNTHWRGIRRQSPQANGMGVRKYLVCTAGR